MKFNKQYLLVGVLIASLGGNFLQFTSATSDRGYAQLGRNLATFDLAKAEMDSKNQPGGSCQITGSLQAFPVGVFTCTSGKVWERARCSQKEAITKDDFGVILMCDGTYWRGAARI